jgi:hypothetical protein
MNEIMTIEEFGKINFRVGEVVEIGKKIKIRCLDKDYPVSSSIKFDKGDKIAIIISGDKLIIPVVNNISLVPGKDVEVGSKIR